MHFWTGFADAFWELLARNTNESCVNEPTKYIIMSVTYKNARYRKKIARLRVQWILVGF